MFVRIYFSLFVSCSLFASSMVVIGPIGDDIWVQGENAALTELWEETAFEPGDATEPPYFTTHSGTPYRLEGFVIFSGGDLGVPVVGPETSDPSFAVGLRGAPEGMEVVGPREYDDGYEIEWTAPTVSEPTAYTFFVEVAVYDDEELLETLAGEVTVSVLPSLPVLHENILDRGIRSRDAGDDSGIYLFISDPDEVSHPSQLTLEMEDPRFHLLYHVSENWSEWTLQWNENYAAPQVSEIVPLQFWMRDWDGTGERWTSAERDLVIFGYAYEDSGFGAPDPQEEGWFGRSLALMDALPGAPRTGFVQNYGTNQVQVFEANETAANWSLKQTLTSPEEELGDFGGSMDSLDDLLAVASVGSLPLDCRVYIYQRDSGTGLWSLAQTLMPDDEVLGGVYGGKVALTRTATGGDSFCYTLMVAADGAASQGEHSGAVWVYESAPGAAPEFRKTQVLVPEDAESRDFFGWPLALADDLAAIPSNEDDDLKQDSGAVYVYARHPETGLWEEQQKLKADDADYGDLFGERVAISERGIFVAAFRKLEGNTRVGAVYQFEPGPTGWEQTHRIRTIEEASMREKYWNYGYGPVLRRDYTLKNFGSSLMAEGDTLLVCGLRQGHGWLSPDRSIVYQFEWDEASGDWVERRALCSLESDESGGGALASNLGNAQALALKSGIILAGDVGSDASGPLDCGSVYAFSASATTAPDESAEISYFDNLALEAPGRGQPNDDADGDGRSNLVELYAGTDPTVRESVALWSAGNPDHPDTPTFSFLSNPGKLNQRPQVYISRTLKEGSWQTLSNPRYLPDTLMGNSIQKTIDLSPQMDPERPLFIRLDYPDIESP
jgi:hypothetical protein